MPLLTREQMLEVRKRTSKLLRVDELDMNLRVVQISGTAANLAVELQKKVEKGEASQQDFYLFTLKHALATEDGQLLDDESALQLLDVLPITTVAKLMSAVNEATPKPETLLGNSKGSPSGA